MAGTLAARALSVATVVLIARVVGPRDYGTLSLGIAYAAVAAYLTDLGLSQTQVREFARPDADRTRILGSSLCLRLALAVPATLIGWAIVANQTGDAAVRMALLSVIATTVWGRAVQGFTTPYFASIGRVEVNAHLEVVGGVVTLALVAGVLWLRAPLWVLCLTYNASYAITAPLAAWLVLRHEGRLTVGDWGIMRGLGAFATGGGLGLVMPQVGMFVMSRTSSLREIGLFAAGGRVPTTLYMIPGLLAAATFPRLFYYGVRDPAKHRSLSGLQIKYMALAGVGVMLPVSLHAGWVTNVVLGARWGEDCARVLTVLAATVVLQSVSTPLADVLTTRGAQRRRAAAQFGALCVAVVSYWQLAGRFGAIGAAYAAVITEGALLVLVCAASSWTRAYLFAAIPAIAPAALVAVTLCGALRFSLGGGLVSFALTAPVYLLSLLAVDREVRSRVLGYARGVHLPPVSLLRGLR